MCWALFQAPYLLNKADESPAVMELAYILGKAGGGDRE